MSCLPDSLSSIILGICTLEQAIFSSRLSMFHLEKITLHQSAQLGVLDGSVGSILSQARLPLGFLFGPGNSVNLLACLGRASIEDNSIAAQ